MTDGVTRAWMPVPCSGVGPGAAEYGLARDGAGCVRRMPTRAFSINEAAAIPVNNESWALNSSYSFDTR